MVTSPANKTSEVVVSAGDTSCRLPLLTMFIGASKWLLVGSVFGLIASIKFHSPNFLADCAWLTYGRVWPAAMNMLLYGFCMQAGLGIVLWLFTRLGRVPLAQGGVIIMGVYLMNFGVLAGVIGILTGDSTGFEHLEIPRYGALLVFLGYLLIGLFATVTFYQRTERVLFPSQWFLLTALFWFAWIYSTANLLVVVFPVRGVAQSVIAWWYGNNFTYLWLGLVGLASIFYFLPKELNRELPSRHLALFTFWTLILFGSWCGIPRTAPVPAWMPAISTVATVLTILTLISLMLNLRGLLEGKCSRLFSGGTPGQFIGFGVIAFFVVGLLNVAGAFLDRNNALNFTWLSRARMLLQVYGFFVMTSFGAIYYLIPAIAGIEMCPKLRKLHFRFAAAGVVLIVVPLAMGGVVEAAKLGNASVPFGDVIKVTSMFLRIETIGELSLLGGHVVLLLNLVGVAKQLYLRRMGAAYANVTEDLFQSAEAKP